MRPNQERLASALQSFKEVPNSNVDWKVGSACVARSNRWYMRGLVTHLKSGTKLLEVSGDDRIYILLKFLLAEKLCCLRIRIILMIHKKFEKFSIKT